VLGPNGAVRWDGDNELVAELADGEGAGQRFVVPLASTGAPEGIAGVLADFLAALDGGPVPMTECHDNIRTFAMVMAALESSRSGRRAPVSSE
jgi:predicted dehydrogenase